jgi:ABC-type spermidine/putrescine transport system permease subunit II
MLALLRLLAAVILLFFYLPLLSGVSAAINDAVGTNPFDLAYLWKHVGTMIADYFQLTPDGRIYLFAAWGGLALVTVVGHLLLTLIMAGRRR